jgi:hypothetical protein
MRLSSSHRVPCIVKGRVRRCVLASRSRATQKTKITFKPSPSCPRGTPSVENVLAHVDRGSGSGPGGAAVGVGAYQSLGGAVERMPVVSPELGVGTLQRGVPLGLGLLDAIALASLAHVDASPNRSLT